MMAKVALAEDIAAFCEVIAQDTETALVMQYYPPIRPAGDEKIYLYVFRSHSRTVSEHFKPGEEWMLKDTGIDQKALQEAYQLYPHVIVKNLSPMSDLEIQKIWRHSKVIYSCFHQFGNWLYKETKALKQLRLEGLKSSDQRDKYNRKFLELAWLSLQTTLKSFNATEFVKNLALEEPNFAFGLIQECWAAGGSDNLLRAGERAHALYRLHSGCGSVMWDDYKTLEKKQDGKLDLPEIAARVVIYEEALLGYALELINYSPFVEARDA